MKPILNLIALFLLYILTACSYETEAERLAREETYRTQALESCLRTESPGWRVWQVTNGPVPTEYRQKQGIAGGRGGFATYVWITDPCANLL